MNIIQTGIAYTKLFWKRHGALTMTIAGTVTSLGAIILACKSTTKLNDTMKEANKEIERVKNDSPDDKGKLFKTYIKGALKLVKLYAPAALLYSVSTACNWGSYSSMRKNNAALAATCASLSNSLLEYRKRVKEKIGEDKEQDIYGNAYEETKDSGKVSHPDTRFDTSVLFCEDSVHWLKDSESNISFVLTVQAMFNRMLPIKRVVFLYDVYKALGINLASLSENKIKMSKLYGWIYDPSDSTRANYIDFGISDSLGNLNEYATNVARECAKDPYAERSIWLNFNCDGDIVNCKKSFASYITEF